MQDKIYPRCKEFGDVTKLTAFVQEDKATHGVYQQVNINMPY
jgi:hypothetical protein